MPEISRFYGIIIKMFYKPKEHEPPHIHAIYGEYVGVFSLETHKMTEGDLPNFAQRLVEKWIDTNENVLINMWNSQILKKIAPLN